MTASIATIATARLLGTVISPPSFDDINRLHTDSQVMKTLSGDGKPLSEEKTRDHIRQSVEHWPQHGFGFWALHRRSDGQSLAPSNVQRVWLTYGCPWEKMDHDGHP